MSNSELTPALHQLRTAHQDLVDNREAEDAVGRLGRSRYITRLIQLRASTGSGLIEFLYPANHRVLAYVRQLGDETILVVNNLSSSAQAVVLDLRRYKGKIPIEMFGRNLFPRVAEAPYLLTMGPYQFYWFRLRRI